MYSYTKPSYLDSYQQRSKRSSHNPFPDVNNSSHTNSYTPSYHQAAGDVRQQMKIQEIMQKHSRDQQRLFQLMNENSYHRNKREEKIQRHSEKTKAEADYILSLRRDNKRIAYLKYLHGQNDHQIIENLYSRLPEKPRSRLSSMDQRHYRIPGSPQYDPRDMNYRDSQYYTEGSPRNNGVKMYRLVKGVRVYETNLMQYEASRPHRQHSSYNKDYSWDPARAHTSPQEEEEDEDDIAIKMWIDGTQPYYTQEDESLNYQSPTSESMRRDEYMSSHHGSQRGSMRGSGRAYPLIGSRKGSYGGKDSLVLDQYMDPRMPANGAKWNSNKHHRHREDDQDYILDEEARGNRNYHYPSPPQHKPMRKPSLNVSFDNRNNGNHGHNNRPRAGSHERTHNTSLDSEVAMRDRNHYASSQHSSGKRSHGPTSGSRQDHNDSAVLDPGHKYNNHQPRIPAKISREKSPSHLNVPQLTHNLSFGAPKDGDSDPFEASEYGHEDLRAPPQPQMRSPGTHTIYSHINKRPMEQRNPQSQPQRKPVRTLEPIQNTQNRTNAGRGRSISGPTPGPAGLEQKSLGPRKVSQNSGDLLKQLQESKDGFVSMQLDQFRDLDQNAVSPRFRNEVLAGGSRGSQMNNSQIPKVVVYDTETKKTMNMEFLKPVKPMGKNRRSSSVKDGGSRVKGSLGNSPLLMKPVDKIGAEVEPKMREEGSKVVENEAVIVKEEPRKENLVNEKVIEEEKKKVEERSTEVKEKEIEEKHQEIKEKEPEKVVEKIKEEKIAVQKVEIVQNATIEKKNSEEKGVSAIKEEALKEEKKGLAEKIVEKVEEKLSEKTTEKSEKTTAEKESEDIAVGKQEESVIEEISEKKEEIEPEEVCEEILNEKLDEEEIMSVEEKINQESVTQEILEEIKSELATKIKQEKGPEEAKVLYPSEKTLSAKKETSEKSESQKKPERTLQKEISEKILEPESLKSIEDGNQSNLSVTSLNLMDKVQHPPKTESSSRRSPQIPKLQSLDKIQAAPKTQAKTKQASQLANAQNSSRKDLLNHLNNLPNEYPQTNPSDKKPIKHIESTKKIETKANKEASKEASSSIGSGSPLSFALKMEEPDEHIFDYLEDVDNANQAGDGLKSSLSESLSRQTLRVPILEEGGDHNDAQSDSTIQGLLGLDVEKKS